MLNAVTLAIAIALCVASPGIASAATPKPGTALKRTGTANCAKVLDPGSEIAFAVKVTGGYSICVTHQGEQWAYYFDGHRGGSASGPDLRSFFGGLGTIRGRLVVFGNLPSSASSMRLTFCTGQTLFLRPLNEDLPQYVGAIVDTAKYGNFFQQPLDASGHPLDPEDARHLACLRNPPSTTKAK